MDPLIVCNGPDCDFAKLIELAKVLINDMVVLSTLLAAMVFAYAGFLLLTSGGNEGDKTKAKDMFFKVLKGYLWILAAWLVVYTITSTLLDEGYYFLK
ncbi:MAG: hypothetical protein EXS69_00075 [Candidatus Zambryskibacteria bacterium]|nr:hypothetical protein [Candidatus Zambryskibacteria bacterium]